MPSYKQSHKGMLILCRHLMSVLFNFTRPFQTLPNNCSGFTILLSLAFSIFSYAARVIFSTNNYVHVTTLAVLDPGCTYNKAHLNLGIQGFSLIQPQGTSIWSPKITKGDQEELYLFKLVETLWSETRSFCQSWPGSAEIHVNKIREIHSICHDCISYMGIQRYGLNWVLVFS